MELCSILNMHIYTIHIYIKYFILHFIIIIYIYQSKIDFEKLILSSMAAYALYLQRPLPIIHANEMKSIFGCSNAQTINYFPLMDNILYSTYLMPLYFDCVHHLFLLIYNAHQNFSVIALLCIGFSSDIFWQCFYIIIKILSVKWYCKTIFSTLWRFILSFMDQNHLVINRKSKQRPTKL